jgi:GDP-mannose 4,6-dehydratase
MSRKFNNCFITGIAGSGGSYLADYIFNQNKKIKIYGTYRSFGFSNYLRKKYKKRIKLFRCDLNNSKRIKKILKKTNPELIFHIASNADVKYSFDNPADVTKNNVMITINLLEAVRQLKINPLIIICSTSEVYGNVKKTDIPIKESQKFNPANPYAASKAFQDFISQIYVKSFNLKIIITRMFSYINARRDTLFQTAFAKQIVNIERKKQKVLKHGNLNSIRTFVDIDDAMSAYWLTATRGKIGEIYNIGGNKIISVKNFLKELIRNSSVKIKTKLDKRLLRPQDVTLQIPSVDKFKKDTRWKQKNSFKVSVINLLNECRKKNIYE